MPLLFARCTSPSLVACLVANLCAIVLDYAARQKVGGINLTYGYLMQFPVLPPSAYAAAAAWSGGQSLADWLRPRVLELIYTSWDLQLFARDLGYDGPPFRWDPDRRFHLRCEVDAAFFHLYGISREADVAYILDTFPIIRGTEQRQCGRFLTKERVIEAYRVLMARSPEGGHEARLGPKDSVANA